MAGEHPSVFVKRVCRAQRIPASAFTNELFPDRKWLASFLEGFDDLAAPKYIYSLAYVLKTPPAVIRRWQENYRRGSTVPRKPKPQPQPGDDERRAHARERYRQRQEERKKWNPESDIPITDWAEKC